MAYVTGIANSISDLLSAIQTACTDNGWTLSGNVLHQGTCYVDLAVSGDTIAIIGGTGIDGSNALIGASDRGHGHLGVTIAGANNTAIPFGWPVTYYVHIGSAPDEVYVVANYAISYYQMISWGQSDMPGLTGSGNWYSGSDGSGNYYGVQTQGEFCYSSYSSAGALFCRAYLSNGEGVDHSLDSSTWAVDDGDFSSACARDWFTLMSRQPNGWNAESILIPVRVYASRPSSYVSPVLECAHARLVHIKNLADQQIITLGSDRWKVYPWWHRGTSMEDRDSSWYAGHAIRYDGP